MLGTLSTYSNPCKCSYNENVERLSNIYLHKGWFSGKNMNCLGVSYNKGFFFSQGKLSDLLVGYNEKEISDVGN